MAGAQFEYDERGGTFYYVVISFYAALLIPATYYFWPRKKEEKDVAVDKCHCEGCVAKDTQQRSKEPYADLKRKIKVLLLLIGWIGLAALAYKCSQIETDHVEYDPFIVLELDRGASIEMIKKQYRKLSMVHHPDRGGNEKKFVAITKAHAALTNDESRENWEKYGNPDGPGATTFGIALPKWLVSKEYGIFVLLAYGFVFMVVLPVGVGVWWYNSIKYSVDQVLMDTTHLYGFMFHKTPKMILKRILMILGASLEFSKQFNKEIIERPSDDKEVPLLIKQLENLGEKKQERPLCYPYSIKARALLHAHLTRIPLNPHTLSKDRDIILRKCPILVQEMLQVIQQLVGLYRGRKLPRMPSIETMESVMKVMPMLVQACWDKQCPLMQLPHFTADMERFCINKKRRIKTCADLASMESSERRSLFRGLSDQQFWDMESVLASMPSISLDVRFEVQGEDDKGHISAGALVTAFVTLTRKALLTGGVGVSAAQAMVDEANEEEEVDEDDDKEDGTEDANQPAAKARKPWEKQKPKQNKKKGGAGGKKKKQAAKAQPPTVVKKSEEEQSNADETPKETPKRVKKERPTASNDDDSDSNSGDYSSDDDVRHGINEARAPETDEEDMEFDDNLIKKDRILETKSKITHPVHSPFYPEEKYEWWWIYLNDRRAHELIAGPTHCTTLIDQEEVELKFVSPDKPGIYTYQVCVRSDSYLDVDICKDIKLEVFEANEIKSHPQWNFESDEEDTKEKSEVSDDEYTENDYEDDDDD